MAIRRSPGPVAGQAFRLGVVAAGLVGLAAVGFLYWTGVLAPLVAVYALVVLFPVYLVLAAAVLSRWLGYDKDETALRPVYRPKQ